MSHGVWHLLLHLAKLWFSQGKSGFPHQSSGDERPELARWSGLEARILCFPCKPKVCPVVDQLPEDRCARQTWTLGLLWCFSLSSITSSVGTLHTPLHKVNACYMTRSSTKVSLKKADQSIPRKFRLGDLPGTALLLLLSLISEHKEVAVWPWRYLIPKSTATQCHTNSFCVVYAKPELDCTQAFLTAEDFLLCQMPSFPRDLPITALSQAVRVDLDFSEPCPLSDITWWVSYHA